MQRPAAMIRTYLLLAMAVPFVSAADPTSFGSLRDQYVKIFLRRFPVVATYLGAEGLDPQLISVNGSLRDYSPSGLESERKEWARFLTELAGFDRRQLPAEDRVDAEVMTAQLSFLVRNLDRKIHQRAIDVYLEEPLRGVEWLIQGMTPQTKTTSGTHAEWEMLLRRVQGVPAYLKVALVNLQVGFPDRRMIQVSIKAAGTTADYFEKSLSEKVKGSVPPAEKEVFNQLLAASGAAAAAFRNFQNGLRGLYFEKDGKTLKPEFDKDRYEIGVAEYQWALKNNLRIDSSPKELFERGKKMVEETQAQMNLLVQRIASQKGWKDASLSRAFAALGEEVPKSDLEMLGWYRDAVQRLVGYARKTKMFEVPGDYRVDVVFTPPPLRDTIDAAYYPAPPFKTSGVGQFYVTPTGDDPAKLRQHARAAIADLAAHEGFPGHDWQYQFLRGRAKSISPVRWLTPGGVEDSASMWEDSMSSEGWALYSEQLVGEPRPGHPDGFYTPEEHLYQLKAQLLRNARVVVDTAIHCGYLTFDGAVEYFARNVHFVRGPISTDPAVNPSSGERTAIESARKAMYRYSKWPTQAITYQLGKSDILQLREDLKKLQGPSFSERRFHESFLLQGTVPAGYFKALLLEQARESARREHR
jgi:uncharacterized protein (DUF885 family)